MEEQVMDEMEVVDAIRLLRVRLEALETKAAYLGSSQKTDYKAR